jgi:hypothetical protein
MTVTLELRPEEVAALEARARTLGVDIAAVLHDMIAQIALSDASPYQKETLAEWEKALDELSEDIDSTIPPLPAAALRRESLYAESS